MHAVIASTIPSDLDSNWYRVGREELLGVRLQDDTLTAFLYPSDGRSLVTFPLTRRPSPCAASAPRAMMAGVGRWGAGSDPSHRGKDPANARPAG